MTVDLEGNLPLLVAMWRGSSTCECHMKVNIDCCSYYLDFSWGWLATGNSILSMGRSQSSVHHPTGCRLEVQNFNLKADLSKPRDVRLVLLWCCFKPTPVPISIFWGPPK